MMKIGKWFQIWHAAPAGYMLAFLWSAVLLFPVTAGAQGSSRYALLIAGLGGTPEYTSQYHSWAYKTRGALIDRFLFAPENITVLADSPSAEEDFIDDVSSAENITAAFNRIAGQATSRDEVYIILFGHGSYDGRNAMLNIPRQDLKDEDYARLTDSIDARNIVFINTASCSGPFIPHVAAPDRIVITATRTGNERNETVFPEFLVQALVMDASDSDKNGDLSLLEVFLFASDLTARWYADSNHLATEHPLMDDTGNRKGLMANELAESDSGDYAAATFLIDRSLVMASSGGGADDPILSALLEEQMRINQEIARLKSEKSNYPELEYYALLEPLFIRLARITGEIEDGQSLR